MLLVDRLVKDFVNAVGSKEPTPGGGSVSALAGSLGAALTAMVGNLTMGKKAYNALDEEIQKMFEDQFQQIITLKNRLSQLVDEDTEAFNAVMAAFKMPKDSEEEKERRKEAIQASTKEALEVPLTAAEQCLAVLRLQKTFAKYGNVNAITDVGVGALMAYSGLEGALFNVKINLQSIKDEDYIKDIENTCETLLQEGKALKEEILKIVYSKL